MAFCDSAIDSYLYTEFKLTVLWEFRPGGLQRSLPFYMAIVV